MDKQKILRSILERLRRNAVAAVVLCLCLAIVVALIRQNRTLKQVASSDQPPAAGSAEKVASANWTGQTATPATPQVVKNTEKEEPQTPETPSAEPWALERTTAAAPLAMAPAKIQIPNPKFQTNSNHQAPMPKTASRSDAVAQREALTPAPSQRERGVGAPLRVEKEPPAMAKKLAAPPADAQKEAARLMEDVYKISQAKTPRQKDNLAQQLFKFGRTPQIKPDERFVLLGKTTELAAEAGDVPLALAAIRQAAGDFDFDSLAAAKKVLARIGKQPLDAAKAKDLFAGLRQVIDQAAAAGRDDLAAELVGLARQLAQRKEGKEYRPLVGQFQAETAKAAAHRQEVRGAQAALAANPDDPEANRALGAWYCLTEGDWEHGLQCLAKGSDSQVRQLAAEDLGSPPGQPDEQVKRAAAWWEAAQGRHGAGQDVPLLRAGYWYEQARGGASDGLLGLSIEKKLGEIAKTTALAAAPRKADNRLWDGAVLLLTFEADTLERSASGAKTIVRDLSGKGNHGEAAGVAVNLHGRAGEALQLDGKGGVVLPALRGCLAKNLKALSISLWFMENPGGNPDGWAYLFNVGGGLGQGVTLARCRGDNSVRFVMPLDGGGDLCRAAGIAGGQWRHVVAVWNGTEERIYIDAELVERAPASMATLNERTLSKEPGAIGRPARPGGNARNFQGLIDEVAVFSRALSERDIYALYQRGLQGECLKR